MRRFLAGIALLLPLSALALTFRDRTAIYRDAPFSPAETAGISVLTDIGAVRGFPDGAFRPRRLLRRGELLKIAIRSHPDLVELDVDDASLAFNCFSDVHASDWFSPYVCSAKTAGLVRGYPDGSFRPGEPVNYVEAVKLLAEIYAAVTSYPEDAWVSPGSAWYRKSFEWAEEMKLLPVALPGDHQLTRGEAARLVAAFYALGEGDLVAYRKAEKGNWTAASSSSVSSSVSSPSSASSVSSSSSSSSLSSPEARSRFLVIGTRSEPIGKAIFRSTISDGEVRNVTLKTGKKILAVEKFILIDKDGKDTGELTPDLTDVDRKRWIATIEQGKGAVMPRGVDTPLFIEAQVKTATTGGFSEEFFAISTLSISLLNASGETAVLAPVSTEFPEQLTALGRIRSVENLLAPTALKTGSSGVVASFKVSPDPQGAVPVIEHLRFSIVKTGTILGSSWKLRRQGQSETHACGSSASAVVECLGLPPGMGKADGSSVLELLAVTSGTGTIKVGLSDPGAIGRIGSLSWTDGTGHFTWVEGVDPLMEGTVMDVR